MFEYTRFSRFRCYRLAALGDHAADKLIETYITAIPLHVQFVLGVSDRTAPTLKSLPKGRIKDHQTLPASTPARPLQRRWRIKRRRVVYFDVVEYLDGTIEFYVGMKR